LLGAGLKKSVDFSSSGEPITSPEITAMAVGVATSAIAGWLVIRFLLNFLRTRSLDVFAYYRIALGLAVLAFMVF
jgi:undecaprenyl-diphosphatase